MRIKKGEIYRNYDSEEIKKAHENHEGTGHGICAVGYDDDRGAVRLMNSWGTDWADDGYCWVSYELFEQNLPWDIKFCMMAFTLYDAPTVRMTPKTQPAGEEGGRTAYSWEVDADARPQALKNLASVVYKFEGGIKPSVVRRDDPATRFALASADLKPSTITAPITITVELTTKSGSTLARKLIVPCEGGAAPSAVRIAEGQVLLPDVRGKSTTEAALRLTGLGLKPHLQRIRDQEPPAGMILGRVARQSPEPETAVSRGSTVTIYVYERR